MGSEIPCGGGFRAGGGRGGARAQTTPPKPRLLTSWAAPGGGGRDHGDGACVVRRRRGAAPGEGVARSTAVDWNMADVKVDGGGRAPEGVGAQAGMPGPQYLTTFSCPTLPATGATRRRHLPTRRARTTCKTICLTSSTSRRRTSRRGRRTMRAARVGIEANSAAETRSPTKPRGSDSRYGKETRTSSVGASMKALRSESERNPGRILARPPSRRPANATSPELGSK
ncbi:hypothetical protein DFJ74DRAFT_664253 [Hyaloraphidium curvatum]|nr:hypothetical protein DFJ74DRAFT_664253 [Hyaloraphidium curvatum]